MDTIKLKYPNDNTNKHKFRKNATAEKLQWQHKHTCTVKITFKYYNDNTNRHAQVEEYFFYSNISKVLENGYKTVETVMTTQTDMYSKNSQ